MSSLKHAFHVLLLAHYVRKMEAAFDKSDIMTAERVYEKIFYHGVEANKNRINDGVGRDPAIDFLIGVLGKKLKYRKGEISIEQYLRFRYEEWRKLSV